MDNLPQELIDQISHFLHPGYLRRTLFVSRKFSYAAERASGAFSSFTFNKHSTDEHQRFLTIFCGRRFRYLRKVYIYTKFPALEPKKREPTRQRGRKKRSSTPEPEPGPCRESLADLQEKDETFTSQVARAFEALKVAEGDEDDSIGRLQLTVLTPTRRVHRCYCDHRRYSSWRVHLLSPEKLPKLHSVQGLSICNPELDYYKDNDVAQSKIDLRVMVDLAARCPNLHYLACKVGTGDWTDDLDYKFEHFMHNHEGCLRDTRNHFAEAIRDVQLPTSLRYAQLDFINKIYEAVSEQHISPPNLTSLQQYDPFSSSLRLLSSRLRKMELRVMADQTLFWPHDSPTSSPWPNLESLSVMFHIASPSGTWYFQSPCKKWGQSTGYFPQGHPLYPPLGDYESDEDWHYATADTISESFRPSPKFRVTPNEETLAPFLESFANAAANMPKLKEAILWAPLTFDPNEDEDDEYDDEIEHEGSDDQDSVGEQNERIDRTDFVLGENYHQLAWGITYLAPGGGPAFDGGENDSSSRQLWWRVGRWHPSEELHGLFQRIGEAQHGDQLIEYWTDSYYGTCLVGQDWFSEDFIFPPPQGTYPAYF